MNGIRLDQTREYIEEKHVVTIRQLQALHPEVSLMTIHRDLDALEQMGVIVKVRGGASCSAARRKAINSAAAFVRKIKTAQKSV